MTKFKRKRGYLRAMIRTHWLPLVVCGMLLCAGVHVALGWFVYTDFFDTYEEGIYPLFTFYSATACIAAIAPISLIVGLAVQGQLVHRRRNQLLVLALMLLASAASCSVVGRAALGTHSPRHLQSVWLDGHVYNLAHRNGYDFDYGLVLVYECDALGIWCRAIYEESDGGSDSRSRLIVDPNEHTVSLEFYGRIAFVHRPTPN